MRLGGDSRARTGVGREGRGHKRAGSRLGQAGNNSQHRLVGQRLLVAGKPPIWLVVTCEPIKIN